MPQEGRPVRGEVVRVRSREEILATLDGEGALDQLPFMPEMLEFCGKELPVSARAHKACDTVYGRHHRRLENMVHLAGARCDGSAHGGCQAGCLLFWREEWLEWPDQSGRPIAPAETSETAGESGAPGASVEALHAATQRPDGDGMAYRCQATELLSASTPIRRRDMWQYVADVRTGNVGLLTVIRGLLIELLNGYQRLSQRRLPRWLRIRGGREYPFIQGTGAGARTPITGLLPGDLVEVRSKEEILRTLGPDNMNRRMLFDSEMLPYCGRQFRVQRNVERILDEETGRMMKLSDCVILDDVVCQGIYHRFCQRQVTPYWREAWLRRVEPSG